MKNESKTSRHEPVQPLELQPPAADASWHKWLPLIMVVLVVAYMASKLVTRAIPGPMNMAAVAKMAVSYEGRIQPLDSLARNELLIISKRTEFRSDWLRPAQVKDWAGLAKKVASDGKAGKDSPTTRLWSLMSPDDRKLVEEVAAATEITPQMKSNLLMVFNHMLDDDGRTPTSLLDPDGHDHPQPVRMYDTLAWKGIELDADLKTSLTKLTEWDKRDPHSTQAGVRPLSRPQVIELNRKLLNAAYPEFISANSAAMEPAIVWLMDVFANQRLANSHRVFRIEHDRVLELLNLESRPGNFRYAIDELVGRMKDLDREANLARNTSSKERDAYQNGLIELAEHLTRFMMLAQYQRPYWVPPPTLKDDWKNFEEIAQESRRTGQVNPDAQLVMTFLQAYSDGDVKTFNENVASHNARLATGFGGEAARAEFETYFNRIDIFYHLTVMYVIVFLMVMLSWMLFQKPALSIALRKSALAMLTLLVVLHGGGMLARMYLMDRPLVFVTNLYASAIFIGFTSIIVALVIEKIQKLGIGSAVAATIGFITGIIALHLRGEGDTLEMQQAVLDTNFWLATHVTTITFGYAATYLAGAIAICFIIGGLFTNAITGDIRKSFGQVIYGVLCFALFLSFVGTVLGGIWADQSWGRFWGWDPKENGAVMIVIWNALILHARWAGMVQIRGMAVLAIVGNIVTTWSWFGTNQLGAGLHSYGFMDKAVFWILVFVATQLIIIGLGLIPTSAWRSFRDRNNDRGPREFAGIAAAATMILLVIGLFTWGLSSVT